MSSCGIAGGMAGAIAGGNASGAAPAVAVGSQGSGGDGAGSEHTGASSGARRKGLTAEERAAQSRYRNREHARNTRLRKKAYMNKLKELVDDLERQRKEDSKVKVRARRGPFITKHLNIRAGLSCQNFAGRIARMCADVTADATRLTP